MGNTRSLCASAFALLLPLAGIAAQPNFTGEWKLNLARSNFGQAPAPKSMVSKVKHHDPSLLVSSHITTDQGEQANEYRWSTDGKENSNIVRGTAFKSVGHWEGEILVVESKANIGGSDITLTDKWSLSDGGGTLTQARHIVTPQGSGDQTYVFEK